MDEAFIEYLRELFADFGPVSARAMFGGHGLYHDGLIFGIVIDDAVYLKVDDVTRPVFEAAGCAPFVYEMKGKPLPMSYWSVPAEAMDSPQAMLPWARRAHEAALRKPLKPVRRRRVR
ncbi:MAG TPA: TfoX/Sxy family protein [Lysobacter sp.]|nr:TfoX/Sxy family protein [Lysobacter sp.]